MTERKKAGRKKSYTPEQKEKALLLLKNLTIREVAARTGLSKSAVHRLSME